MQLVCPYFMSDRCTCRYIFWVDWGTTMIERASMDGSDRRVIASGGLHSPVSLTLDYSSQTLYWIDGDGTLEKSYIDGSGRTLLLSADSILYNTFGMAFYSNRLYWTERKEEIVYSAPINDLSSYSVLITSLTYEPYQLQVVHPLAQPAAGNSQHYPGDNSSSCTVPGKTNKTNCILCVFYYSSIVSCTIAKKLLPVIVIFAI